MIHNILLQIQNIINYYLGGVSYLMNDVAFRFILNLIFIYLIIQILANIFRVKRLNEKFDKIIKELKDENEIQSKNIKEE